MSTLKHTFCAFLMQHFVSTTLPLVSNRSHCTSRTTNI